MCTFGKCYVVLLIVVQCCVVHYCAVLCSFVQCYEVLCSIVQCSVGYYSGILVIVWDLESLKIKLSNVSVKVSLRKMYSVTVYYSEVH